MSEKLERTFTCERGAIAYSLTGSPKPGREEGTLVFPCPKCGARCVVQWPLGAANIISSYYFELPSRGALGRFNSYSGKAGRLPKGCLKAFTVRARMTGRSLRRRLRMD